MLNGKTLCVGCFSGDIVTMINNKPVCSDCERLYQLGVTEHVDTQIPQMQMIEAVRELDAQLAQLDEMLSESVMSLRGLLELKRLRLSMKQTIEDFLFGPQVVDEDQWLSEAVEEHYAGMVHEATTYDAFDYKEGWLF